jgi:hypothetical protein
VKGVAAMGVGKLSGLAWRVAIAALAGGGVIAMAAPSGAQTSKSPAIIGPLLTTMTFGDEIALPTGCGLLGGVIEAASAYVPGSGAAISPLFTKLSAECGTIASTGYVYLSQASAAVAPLSAWNPILDPEIAQIGAGVQAFGTNYGTEFGPFGPTIAGFGNTIDYFEGN